MGGARRPLFRGRSGALPDSLLLLFNEAHWSFFKPNADTRRRKQFHHIIERFDDLAFDVHGADVAFAYTLHELDAVFPCYEYADVATSELVLQSHARASRPQRARAQHPRHHSGRVPRLCRWAKLKNRDTAGGLAWLKYAMELYPHGLPTQRLYFDTLLRLSAEAGKLTPALASDLAEAFIAVVNINPSILLTHVYTIVPILADNGERQAAKDILAAWHRLANIVHKLRTDDEKHQLALLAILWDSLAAAESVARADRGGPLGSRGDARSYPTRAAVHRGRAHQHRAGEEARMVGAQSRKATADHVARLLAEADMGRSGSLSPISGAPWRSGGGAARGQEGLS